MALKKSFLACVACFTFAMMSCLNEVEPKHKVAAIFDQCIAISKSAITVGATEEDLLELEVKLADNVLNLASLEWLTSNENVVEIVPVKGDNLKVNLRIKGVKDIAFITAKLVPYDIYDFGENVPLEAKCMVQVVEYVPPTLY